MQPNTAPVETAMVTALETAIVATLAAKVTPPENKEFAFCITAVKNRDLVEIPDDYEIDQFWYRCKTTAERYPKLDGKYPGYLVYDAKIPGRMHDELIMPAKAYVSCEFMGATFGFNLAYNTVKHGAWREVPRGGLMYLSVADMRVPPSAVDYSTLSTSIWKQGTCKTGHRVLIQLQLYTSYKGILMKDDGNGDVYCYRPSRILILLPEKKQA
jgi:hypothetical protein